MAQPRFWRILRSVPRPIASAVGMSSGSERISTTSAVSMATSVPAPMAIPRSAAARAGASFTPSPTMATLVPGFCSPAILLAFSPGSTSAITVRTPSCPAIRRAVASLSPVSMTTSTPASASVETAAARGGPGGVGDADQRGRAPVDGHAHDGPPGRGHLLAAARERPQIDAFPGHQAGVPDGHLLAVYPGQGTVARDVLEFLGAGHGNTEVFAAGHDGLGQRVLRFPLYRGGAGPGPAGCGWRRWRHPGPASRTSDPAGRTRPAPWRPHRTCHRRR